MTATLTEQRVAAPTRWSIDDAESSIEFAVKTFWGLTTVHGRLDRFDGWYETSPTSRSTSSAAKTTQHLPNRRLQLPYVRMLAPTERAPKVTVSETE